MATKQNTTPKEAAVTSSDESVILTVTVPLRMFITGYFPKDTDDLFREEHGDLRHVVDMEKLATQPAALAYVIERGLAHLRDAATPAATGDNKNLPLVERHAIGNNGMATRIEELEKGIVPAGGGRGSTVSSMLKYIRDLLCKQVSSAADRKVARALKSVDDAKKWHQAITARQYGDDTTRAEATAALRWDTLMSMVTGRIAEDQMLVNGLPEVEMDEEGNEATVA